MIKCDFNKACQMENMFSLITWLIFASGWDKQRFISFVIFSKWIVQWPLEERIQMYRQPVELLNY